MKNINFRIFKTLVTLFDKAYNPYNKSKKRLIFLFVLLNGFTITSLTISLNLKVHWLFIPLLIFSSIGFIFFLEKKIGVYLYKIYEYWALRKGFLLKMEAAKSLLVKKYNLEKTTLIDLCKEEIAYFSLERKLNKRIRIDDKGALDQIIESRREFIKRIKKVKEDTINFVISAEIAVTRYPLQFFLLNDLSITALHSLIATTMYASCLILFFFEAPYSSHITWIYFLFISTIYSLTFYAIVSNIKNEFSQSFSPLSQKKIQIKGTDAEIRKQHKILSNLVLPKMKFDHFSARIDYFKQLFIYFSIKYIFAIFLSSIFYIILNVVILALFYIIDKENLILYIDNSVGFWFAYLAFNIFILLFSVIIFSNILLHKFNKLVKHITTIIFVISLTLFFEFLFTNSNPISAEKITVYFIFANISSYLIARAFEFLTSKSNDVIWVSEEDFLKNSDNLLILVSIGDDLK